MQIRTWTDEQLILAVGQSKTIAQVLKALGLIAAGGNYRTIKDAVQRLNLDTSHFTGQAWSNGKQLKHSSGYTRATALKPHLIRERGHRCQNCGLTTWFEKPIPLELEHVDGNTKNNDDSNLLLLCCNCHAQTPTWRRGKAWLASNGS